MTDSCPNCCARGCEPVAEERRGDQIAHAYRCPACGHQWATARHLPSYSELRGRRSGRADEEAAA